MSDPDPLAAIKARWSGDEQHRAEWWADHAGRDVPWLVGEIDRLRDLLARLEWAGTEVDWDEPDAWAVCPACHRPQSIGHEDGSTTHSGPDGQPYNAAPCWLAAVLAPERETTP